MYNISMDILYFKWDETINQLNIIKHGISFEEAKTVFDDIRSVVFADPEHSYDENRFLVIGISKSAKTVL